MRNLQDMEKSVFNFQKDQSLIDWYIVDDVVMGGRSRSMISVNDAGNGVFEGIVSLENKGGFSSVRLGVNFINLEHFEAFRIKLTGDGKRYQLRVKSNLDEAFAYVAYFETTTDWQLMEIPFKSMEAQFRGRKLNMPVFPGKTIAEIGFMIANGEAGSFKLELSRMSLI